MSKFPPATQLSNSGMKPNNIHITFLISLFIRAAFLYVCGMMIKKPKNIRICLWLWKNILFGLIMYFKTDDFLNSKNQPPALKSYYLDSL